GAAAIAAARMAWRSFGDWTTSARWRELAASGAKPQRLLWASTSTKDPAYDALRYVEALAGPQTVNTLPSATLDAYRRDGRPEARLHTGAEEAASRLQELQQLGIDMEEVAVMLEREGVHKFVEPFERLLDAIGAQLPGR